MESVYQQIEDYLNDRLDDTTKADFEARMAVEADLKEEVVKMQLLRQIAKRNATRTKIQEIQAQKLAEWKEEENNQTEEVEEEESRPKFKIWRNLSAFAAAASVIFVLFATISSFNLPNQATLTERGNSEELDKIQKANFDNYLKAQKALQSGDNETAILYFKIVQESTEIRPYYRDAATWYLAVANVEKHPEVANEIMQDIASKQDFKYEISTMDKVRMWCKIQWGKAKGVG